MPTLYDLAYRALLAMGAPAMWLRRDLGTKLAKARRERNGDVPFRRSNGSCVLIHAVSVGEVNATREMVARLISANIKHRRGAWDGSGPREPSAQMGPTDDDCPLHIVVSVTTDTGFARARHIFSAEPFAQRVTVVRYPLDFSSYVRRFLDLLRLDLAVLMELEVWPNFVLECRRRQIPVLLVNGRLTERSFRSYRRFRFFVKRVFGSLTAVCAQEEAYARRFVELGVPAERVSVTGTMKFDAAQVENRVEGGEELAQELGLRPRALGGSEPVLICGSTGPGEEELLRLVYERLRVAHSAMRLVVVPRKPERFDEVARWFAAKDHHVLRRSKSFEMATTPATAVDGIHPDDEAEVRSRTIVLGDTMGELRKFYSLADVVVVGRTLLDLGEKQHGSDMIEPAALGKPVVVGPYTGNFAEPMRALLAAGAIRQISPKSRSEIIEQLVAVLEGWLRDPAAAAEVGRRAREVVLANRGATERHVEIILHHLAGRTPASDSPSRGRQEVAS